LKDIINKIKKFRIIIGIVVFQLFLISTLLILNCCGLYGANKNEFITTSILIIIGFGFQVIAVYLAFKYGLDIVDIQRKNKANEIFENLKVDLRGNYKIHNNVILIVKNDSDYPITDCVAYISIDNKQEDYVNTYYTYEDSSNNYKVDEVKLSWAKVEGGKHQYKIDINSNESQDLLFCRFHNVKTLGSQNKIHCIEIPSEEGYANEDLQAKSRCFLYKNRYYIFTIKIVCKEARGKEFIFKYILEKDDFEKIK
jgi:hypothetical protein